MPSNDRESILNSKMLKSSPNKPLNSMIYALTESRNLLVEDVGIRRTNAEISVSDLNNLSDNEEEEEEQIENENDIWERKTFGRLSILNKRGSTALDARRLGG